jgi:hypothetical protein
VLWATNSYISACDKRRHVIATLFTRPSDPTTQVFGLLISGPRLSHLFAMAKNKKIRIREETCSSHFSQLECTPAIVWDILASPSTPSPFPQLQSSGCIAWYGLDMKNADKNEAEYEGDMLLSWLVAERVAFSPYYCGAIAHLRASRISYESSLHLHLTPSY